MSDTNLRIKIGAQTFMSYLDGGSDTLLVVFSSAYYLQRQYPHHYRRALRLKIPTIIFESESDFFCADWTDIVDKISEISQGYGQIISYGFSMGGYAALRLALESNKVSKLVSCYALSPHLKLTDPHSRAKAIGGDFIQGAPNLIDGLSTMERLPSIKLIFPTQSMNDSIHVEDAVSIRCKDIENIFVNTGHGIEDYLKSCNLLDDFLRDICSRRIINFPDYMMASPEHIRREILAVPWLRYFEGESQVLPNFPDDDVTDSVWHFKKSIVFSRKREWDSFWEAASRCAKLAGPDKFWVSDYFDIYNDGTLPDRMAAGILQLGLRYSMDLVDKITQTTRYERIIFDQVDVVGLALLSGSRDCVPEMVLNRFLKCDHLPDLQIMLNGVLSRQGNANAKYFLSRHAFESGYYAVAESLLSIDPDKVDAAAAWETYFLIGSVLSANGNAIEAKKMFERAENLTTSYLPRQALDSLMNSGGNSK